MCKTCQKNMSRVAGRKKSRRRRSKISGFMKGSTSGVLTQVGGAVGGYIVAKFINNMDIVAANPILKIAAPAAGAVAVGMFMGRSALASAVATGMYVEAGAQAVQQFVPSVAAQVGLSGTPYRTYLTPGVAGNSPGVFI